MGARSDIDRLAALAGDFSAAAARERRELLSRLVDAPIRSAPLLKKFHALLLHVLAFPDSSAALELARTALAQFPRRVSRAGRNGRTALLHSGIAGTRVDYPFTHVNARWLASRWPDDVAIDWAGFDGAAKLDALLARICTRNELQVFDDAALGTAAWLRLAMGGQRGGEPAWLFRECDAAGIDCALVEQVYNDAEVPLRWQLDFTASRSGNRLDPERPVFRTAMRRLPDNPPHWIQSWRGAARHVPEAEGRRIIDVVQSALLVRCREVFAHQHANPADVYRVDLGAGAEVMFLGSQPSHRLGLESNYGYMLFVNGVPLGYGGVTSLLGQGNTGVNVFEEFRRGESAYLYAAVLGAARRLFGCERFIVNPYQFGAGNAEAIRSGAFWFYYRLGFRPVDETVRRRAAREFERLSKRRGLRTPPALLRAFTGCDLELVLPGYAARPRFEEHWLAVLARRATTAIGQAGAGSRRHGKEKLRAQVMAALRISTASWSRAEQNALADLAPVLAQIPDLATWPAADRRSLVQIIRARGAGSERRFAELTARHLRLRRALARVAT